MVFKQNYEKEKKTRITELQAIAPISQRSFWIDLKKGIIINESKVALDNLCFYLNVSTENGGKLGRKLGLG